MGASFLTQIMPRYQARPIHESELDELVDLLYLVHQHPQGHERYRSYIDGDPTWCAQQTPVIVVDGRLVSTLRIWDRHVHLGATPVRMGGIGGVTTHPDFRGRGLASQLMKHAGDFMRSDGYELGVLFTMIPARFYRRLGWCSIPLTGFRATLRRHHPDAAGPAVIPFVESRDLEETVALYERLNAGRSGTLLRPRPYWDYAPSRARCVMPTVVARDETGLLGYLNWSIESDGARVSEVAWTSAPVLQALVQHLLAECDARSVTETRGEIPHNHPFVDALVATAEADLQPTGDGSMMTLPLDMTSLIDRIAPEATDAIRRLPTDLLCRLLFGESSGRDVMPLLSTRGIELGAQEACQLEELFPRRELIFWSPDHF